MADGSEAFDFEALDEESELSSGITSQTDGALLTGKLIEKARFVTVLSDFGETEKFVLEGDSLLLWAFEQPSLDWKHGGQFLHLIFVIEKFLSEFLKRGSHFAVVFFANHEKMWADGSKLLARSLLISHLKQHLSSLAAVCCFDSSESQEWIDFLLTYNPAFFLLSDSWTDGAAPNDVDSEGFPVAALASMVNAAGINLIFLRNLEFDEHSVNGFYVPSQSNQTILKVAAQHIVPRKAIDVTVVSKLLQSTAAANILEISNKNWRSLTCCWALSTWLSRIKADSDYAEASKRLEAEAVAKIFLVQITLLRRKRFGLRDRCLHVLLSEDVLRLVHLFQDHIFRSIACSAWAPENFLGSNDVVIQQDDVVDFSDGRLFCSLLEVGIRAGNASPENLGLDSSGRDEVEALWLLATQISEYSLSDGKCFPVPFGSDTKLFYDVPVSNIADTLKKDDLSESVGLSNCSFLSQILGVEVPTREASPVATSLQNILESEMNWQFADPLESFLWTHCKDQSASVEPSSRSTSEWERKRQLRWKARQSQMYFRHLHDYSASLAGTTVLGSTCISAVPESSDSPQAEEDAESIASEQSAASKKSAKGKADKKKPEKKLSKKEQMLADIEAKKLKGAAQKLELEWKELKVALKKSSSTVAKIKDLDDFINRCLAANQTTLALEVTLEKLSESKLGWQEDRDSKSTNMKFAILTVETVRVILVTHGDLLKDPALPIAAEARIDIVQTMVQLGFTDSALQLARSLLDPTNATQYTALQEEAKEIARLYRNKLSVASKSLAHFQLEHMGYLLPRPPPKVKDPRITTFTPDDWQRALLDVVDARESALVCAPTSSGKTFISYYCMEKVMRDLDHKDGILVFVAPTKALINQIAAQVYGAYHSHFGIYVDSYRHRALTCRILVTVPECLESLLMSPEHAVWAQRIRYIILDEVHCISTSDGGRLWEHILLLCNAPFLALSATVGEPEAFVSWLQSLKDVQREGDGGEGDETYNVRLVQHSERWVDLRRHVYVAGTSKAVDSTNVMKAARLHVRPRVDHTSAEIDMAEVLETLHPFASFTDAQLNSGKVPVNLRFEPRDSLALFNAMLKVYNDSSKDHAIRQRGDTLSMLDPLRYFSGDQIFITKPQSFFYERDIKSEFETWMCNGWKAECVKVLKLLGNEILDVRKDDDSSDEEADVKVSSRPGLDGVIERVFHLMCALHRQDRLPAVVFNFDRTFCENIAFGINAILGKAEEGARSEHAKTLAKSAKAEVQKEKVQKRIRDKVVSEKKEEAMLQEMAEMAESSNLDVGLDEVTFKAQFTFVQEGRSSAQDFERITESARKIMGEGHPLIQILRRGIGVHHSGLQNKYRMAVEMLFRCGYLRIVVATETLAFGINMPCRSVIFAGDNVALNSIQYQQMSGRAGRRGLDVLGHVIFFDVPRHKMHRLIVSPVPKLHGHFLHSPTFLLRLLTLYSLTPRQRGASQLVVNRVRNAVSRALRQSLYDAVNPRSCTVRLLQARLLIDAFVRDGLVDQAGNPKGLMTFAAHFHSMEPANLALVALLQSGALHKLCEQPEGQGWNFTSAGPVWRGGVNEWEIVARNLLVVLSTLFCRARLHSSLALNSATSQRRGTVVLPPLPTCCEDALNSFHKSCLHTLVAAANGVAAATSAKKDVQLPLSKLEFGLRHEVGSIPGLREGVSGICDDFAALSGNGDRWRSAEELVSSAREELGLHPALLPLPLSPGPLLSAYVMDFFAHEQLDVVCRECGMCSAAAWQGLREFQLILSSLHKAMASYAPRTDILLASISRLEGEYSAKFYTKLYR